MNVISGTRALRAINAKLERMQKRRLAAKDKPRWDIKNGDDLATQIRHQTKLIGLLLDALAEQGQFEHTRAELEVGVLNG